MFIALPDKNTECRTGHGPLPIGTIRVHAGVRRIKIRLDGPSSYQWMDYARWWWINNRGPVPQGKRVAHEDGNTLNDDPSNLVLVTPDEIAFLWHDRNPAGSRRNYEKCRKATSKYNRMRALIRRELEWLPSKWYAVDLDRRQVWNEPQRKRHLVYRARGLGLDVAANGRGIEAAVLGWPEISSLAAMVLQALADGQWLDSAELLARVNAIRSDFGLSPVSASTVHGANVPLRADGYLLVHRRGRLLGRYHIGRRAVEQRQKPLGVVAVRGSELIDNEKYRGFARINPATPTREEQAA